MQVVDGATGEFLACVTDEHTATISVEGPITGYWPPEDPYGLVLNEELLPWSEAEAHCVELGGHLATIDTMVMAEHVDAKVSYNPSPYLTIK